MVHSRVDSARPSCPEWLEFYNRYWEEIRPKASLAEVITEVTGIARLFHYRDACVAEKFSWASGGNTTRLEDQAYCLMGLFDVNMPLLYGEGHKAFLDLNLRSLIGHLTSRFMLGWHPGQESCTIARALAPDFYSIRYCGRVEKAIFVADYCRNSENRNLFLRGEISISLRQPYHNI